MDRFSEESAAGLASNVRAAHQDRDEYRAAINEDFDLGRHVFNMANTMNVAKVRELDLEARLRASLKLQQALRRKRVA